jgi:hypothetical protein
MTNSQTSIPAAAFVSLGVVLLAALSFVMVRSDFGPPAREIIPFGGVAAIAVALLLVGLTVLRRMSDLQTPWRVGRVWGLLFGATLLIGNTIAKLAPVALRESGPLPHAGHVPEIASIFVKLFVVTIAGLFLTAGFFGAWRTSQVRQGILAATATAIIGALIVVAGSVASAIVFAVDIALTGGGIPIAAVLVVPMLSTFPGTVGALFGCGFGRMRSQAS